MKRTNLTKSKVAASLVSASAIFIGTAGCSQQKQLKMGGMNMTWVKLTTNMMVEDVNRTVDFYANVLDCEFVMGVLKQSQDIATTWDKNQPLDFAIVKCGDMEMMFQARESLVKEVAEFKDMKVGGSVTFYVEVKDVNRLYSRIRSRVHVVKEPSITFYGMKEFYIRDCNGYVLTFAERT